jgi:SAM-dependent methyltransferase
MSTPGSRAGRDLFDQLNIDYEKAYHDNEFKVSCVRKAISMLPLGSRVLDVGCGTGMPVSEMLSKAGLQVVGCDISPRMIQLAQERVDGSFTVSDMLEYKPEGKFAAVFIIFSQLQLSYADFHSAAYKYANALQVGGILAIGQMPSDIYVKDDSCYDETRTYVEDYETPFMGEQLPTLMLSAKGQLDFLRSMGLEIVSDAIDTFQPNNEKCEPEEQQYIIARRPNEQPLAQPRPLPRAGELAKG